MRIEGHTITDRQLTALHGVYRGQVKDGSLYGVNVHRTLEALADRGIITRSVGTYLIPWDGPGAQIIAATRDFSIGEHL